jgi:hypothetical protein
MQTINIENNQVGEEFIKHVILEKVKIAVSVQESNFVADMELESRSDYISQNLIYTLFTFMAGQKHKVKSTVYYPATWWDALKERIFRHFTFTGKWAKVNYTAVPTLTEITNLCPHITDGRKDTKHIEFVIHHGMVYNKNLKER